MARSAKVAAIREWARQQQADQQKEQTYEEFADFTDQDLEGEARAAGDNAQAEKIRENRLRRMAHRQGLRVYKSRRRDPRAIDYGGYLIADDRNRVVAGDSSYSMDLDDVERYLSEDDTR